KELPVAFREVIAHAGHRRVPQAREQTRLALKSFAQELLCEETFFERDGVAEALIYRKVNSAHATFANRADDLVTMLQDGVWLKHGGLLESIRSRRSLIDARKRRLAVRDYLMLRSQLARETQKAVGRKQ